MRLQPGQDRLVGAHLDLLRPETVVIIMPAEPRHADPDRILRPADDPVAALRIILEAENQLRQRPR